MTTPSRSRISSRLRSVMILSGFAMAGLSAMPFAAAQAQALNAEQKKEIEALVADYIKNNPEKLIESLESFRNKQEQEAQEQAEKKVGSHLAALTAASQPSVGPADADVTIVEFYDYNCGYCKKAYEDVRKLVDTDKKVRIVFQDMPILSENSMLLAQWSLAAHKQGKYFEFHQAIMEHAGPKDEAALTELANKSSLDSAKLKADAASDDVKAALKKVIEAAQDIGIGGTPAFIVNGKLARGYMGPDGLSRAVEQARQGK